MYSAQNRGAPRVPRGVTSIGGFGGPFRGPMYQAQNGGAPRGPRGVTSVGGLGGPFRGPPCNDNERDDLERGREQPRRARQLPRAARRDEVREGQREEAGADEIGDAAQ